MRNLVFLLAVLALAACAGQPGAAPKALPTTPPLQPAQAVAPTRAPTSEPKASSAGSLAAPAPAEPNTQAAYPAAAGPDTQAAAPASGAQVYQIVPEKSQVRYEVGEVFLNRGNVFNRAVGVTQGISGVITVDQAQPQNSQLGVITVDISQFKSDSARRDGAIRERFLESGKYPQVTFKLLQIEGLPASIQEGVDYPLKITGEVTIRDTTKPVVFDTTARLNGDTLSGTATTTILMSDFGFGPINILNVLKTEDEAKVVFDFTATRG